MAMLRTRASRLLVSSLGPVARPASSLHHHIPARQWNTQFGTLASRRPQTSQLARLSPIQSSIARRNVSKEQLAKEKKYGQEELKPHPETVSSTSSTHALFSEVGTEDKPASDVDVLSGVRADVSTIKETFSLRDVPSEAYYMGLAGTFPYLATSITTVYCAWEINHATAGYGLILDSHQATQLLHLLEPLQIGYGASILSFLGAIHWGLEWAGFGGYQGYKRYAIGVVAPAVAWSTILMPIEAALITQFVGFTGLYYVDTRATIRGWTPAWYREYRFVLTFIVGASILLSLIGRGELPDHVPAATDRAKVFRDHPEETLAAEEAANRERKKEAARKDDRGE